MSGQRGRWWWRWETQSRNGFLPATSVLLPNPWDPQQALRHLGQDEQSRGYWYTPSHIAISSGFFTRPAWWHVDIDSIDIADPHMNAEELLIAIEEFQIIEDSPPVKSQAPASVWKHLHKPPMCAATTQRGTPCTRLAGPDGVLCVSHARLKKVDRMLPSVPKIRDIDTAFPTSGALRDALIPYSALPDEFKGVTRWSKLFDDLFFSSSAMDYDRLGLYPTDGVKAVDAWDALVVLMGVRDIQHEHKTALWSYLASVWFQDVRWEITRHGNREIFPFNDAALERGWLEMKNSDEHQAQAGMPEAGS